MTGEGRDTRTVLMDAAESLVLRHGLAGTTVDSVVDEAGVTKGTFFYHFDTKNELARALVERYEAHDEDLMDRHMTEAERRSDDPLRQVLTFVELFEEQMEELTEPFPGCLFASYCYQNEMYDDESRRVVREGLLRWRTRVGEKLRRAIERHPPRESVDPEELADMLTAIFEGSFILSKTLSEPAAVARQLAHYRRYLRLLFTGEAGRGESNGD